MKTRNGIPQFFNPIGPTVHRNTSVRNNAPDPAARGGEQEKVASPLAGAIEIVWLPVRVQRQPLFRRCCATRRGIVVTFGDTSPLTFATTCRKRRQRARTSPWTFLETA